MTDREPEKQRQGRRLELPQLDEDGLRTRRAGNYVEQKLRLLQAYASIFARGMKNRFDERIYVDLFAGPGADRVERTGAIFCGSPLLVAGIPEFTKHILCEQDTNLISDLKRRFEILAPDINRTFVLGDVNERVEIILREIPRPSKGRRVLTLCFADPEKIEQLPLATIEALATIPGRPVKKGRRIDFMMLIPTGMDVNRNLEGRYFQETDERVARYLGKPDWRARWERIVVRGRGARQRFIAREYCDSMEQLGYYHPRIDHLVPVKIPRGALLYHIGCFSRDPRGLDFWEKARESAEPQPPLRLRDARPERVQ